MKTRTNSAIVAAIATAVFMFAAMSLAVAQVANYKAGDKIEVLSGWSCVIPGVLMSRSESLGNIVTRLLLADQPIN